MAGMARHCRYEEEGFAAAYALGLLDGAELAEYAAHLAECPICPTEVAANIAASTDLALADDDTPDIVPTPDARARLLAAAVAERDERATATTAPIPAVVPIWRRLLRLVPLAFAAALVLFIGAGLLLRILVPGAGAPSPKLAPAVFSFGTTGGAAGQATYRADQRLLRLSFQGLPLLNPGQVYQLWLLRAEGPESIQVFRLADGTGTTSVTVDLTPYRALYVTIEPAPDGSRAPTTGAVVAAALPGSAGSSGGAVPTLPCPTAVPSCETPPLVRGTATRTTVATPRGTALPIRTPTDQLPATRVVAPVDPSPTTLPTSSPMTAPSPVPRGTLDVPLVPARGTGDHVTPDTSADGARPCASAAGAAAPARHTRVRTHQGDAAAHTRNIRPGAIAGGTTVHATVTDRAADARAVGVGPPYRATADGTAARADPAIGADNPACAPTDTDTSAPSRAVEPTRAATGAIGNARTALTPRWSSIPRDLLRSRSGSASPDPPPRSPGPDPVSALRGSCGGARPVAGSRRSSGPRPA